jgi:enamine deaminase RidA (YjgF/YER057c/UK114 family)
VNGGHTRSENALEHRASGKRTDRVRSGGRLTGFREEAARLYSGPRFNHREDSVSTRFINPATISKPPGYTHVVEATTPGRIVYVAGQLGLDVEGKVAGAPGDFRAQAKQTFENLKNALAAVGATFKDVVKLNNYLTDLGHLPIFREVRDSYLNTQTPPASTTIQISKLAREGALLETEAIAILPAKTARPARARAPARSARSAARASRSKPAPRKRK